MSEALDRLFGLTQYYSCTRARQVGHTQAIIDALRMNPDTMVVVPNLATLRNYVSRGVRRDRVIILGNSDNLRGLNRPLLIEPFLLEHLVAQLVDDRDARNANLADIIKNLKDLME